MINRLLWSVAILISSLSLGCASALLGCGDDGIARSEAGGQQADSPSGPVIAAMDEAIQHEYRAEATYQRVIDTLGSEAPFTNIVKAERRHIAELSALYGSFGQETPESEWNSSNVPTYASIESACSAGASGEKENIAMYDRLLALDLPDDVRQTFDRLRAATLVNHLPALEGCASISPS